MTCPPTPVPTDVSLRVVLDDDGEPFGFDEWGFHVLWCTRCGSQVRYEALIDGTFMRRCYPSH